MRDDYETERLLLRIAGLVRRLDVLRMRGAGRREVEETRLELERLRWRLAHVVRKGITRESRVA